MATWEALLKSLVSALQTKKPQNASANRGEASSETRMSRDLSSDGFIYISFHSCCFDFGGWRDGRFAPLIALAGQQTVQQRHRQGKDRQAPQQSIGAE